MLKASLITSIDSFDTLDFYTRLTISKGAAYAPNPNTPPLYADLPIIIENNRRLFREDVWKKWLKFSPASDEFLSNYKKNARNQSLGIDVGRIDDLAASNETFSRALAKNNIDHMFEIYGGDHLNQISNRLTSTVLPYFSGEFKRQMEEAGGIFTGKYSLVWPF